MDSKALSEIAKLNFGPLQTTYNHSPPMINRGYCILQHYNYRLLLEQRLPSIDQPRVWCVNASDDVCKTAVISCKRSYNYSVTKRVAATNWFKKDTAHIGQIINKFKNRSWLNTEIKNLKLHWCGALENWSVGSHTNAKSTFTEWHETFPSPSLRSKWMLWLYCRYRATATITVIWLLACMLQFTGKQVVRITTRPAVTWHNLLVDPICMSHQFST